MRRTWIGIGLAIFLAAAAAGYLLTRPLAAELLHPEVEARLSEILGSEVRVAKLRVSLGLALRLEGGDVEVWPEPDGPSLRIDRLQAVIRPFSHLTGQRRLRELRIQGARLRVSRSATGAWSPPPAAAMFAEPPPRGPEEPRHPHELLRPLIALESMVRYLLTKPLVADALELQDGQILLVDAAAGTAAGAPRSLAVEGIQAQMRARRLLSDTRLRLRARLRDEAGERGAFEWEGSCSRAGELRIAVAATALRLEALAPLLRELRPEAKLAGTVSGVMVFEAPSPGHGRFEVDLIGHELHSIPPAAPASWELGPLEASRVEISGALAISPQQVRLDGAQFSSDDLDLQLDGVVERPLHAGSKAQLALAIREVTLAEVRHLIGWLPEIRREEAEAVVARLEVGRLRLLRAGGTAELSGWQAFLAGRTRELPLGFVVDAELADTTVRVGDSDRIEDLSGRLWWTGDRIEIRRAHAHLNGSPLPELDLSIEGVSNLFAPDPEARKLPPGTRPLAGLRPLWQALAGDGEEGGGGMTSLRLEIERLAHPMFFWPIENAVASIQPIEGGIRIETSGGTWAGVPVSGEADWLFEPDERIRARFAATPPIAPPSQASSTAVWAEGRFEAGALHQKSWPQRSARGRFHGEGAEVRISEAEILLAPSGRVRATASLDLSRSDAVPYAISFAIEGGQVSTLAGIVGLPPELATGRLDAAASLAGLLDPKTPPSRALSGLLELEARDGTLRQALPAIVAISLASELFNPFASREQVRYARIHTLIELDKGRLRTDGFTLDGPDVRAFASGAVDICRKPHPVDAEVVLFLFRPVDAVLEKIPLVNLLLLGSNENLVAAHFELRGPWEDPQASLVPLRSLTQGPGSLVFETLPGLVRRGLEELGFLLSEGRFAEQERPEKPAEIPRGS